VAEKTFNKKDLVKILNIKTGYSLNFSKKLVNDIIEILITNIIYGDLILKNIGSFRLIHKKKRIGRNPKTKEEFIIHSRKSISFTPSKKISNSLNKIYE